VETMNYDFVGNLTSKVDFNGKTTSYAYDSLNRLLSKTPDASFSGAAAIVMTYTSTGQRASMTDASGASSFTYDSRDRLKTKVTPQGTLTYTYDGASNVTRVVSSNANGTDVNYTFDANNRLATVVDNRTAGTTTYSYDATNQLSGFAYPNGVGHVHTYDNRDRLTNVAVNGPSGVLANYGQTFSPSSHKTAVNENSGRAVNYSYDSIYRLLNESITGNANSALNGALAYGLDPVGNRLSLTSTLAGIAAQTNTFDSNDRLVADTYDANGNTLASGGNTFGYEFEDRLTSYNAGAITYLYDGDGNRVARTEAGSTTRFLIDDLTPTGYAQVAEEVVAGFVVRQYTHGLMRVSQRQNIGGTWTTSYYGYDGFGSTRQLLDGAGVVTDTFAFDGFGNLVVRTGTTPNQYLYRGEALDAGTGMYYLRARWYRPGVGLFATQDTYEGNERQPKTLQLYAFPETDPINLVDPSGHGGRIISLGLILANITIHNAAKIEQVGLFTRGQLSLGVSSIVRASYFQQLMANADPVAGRMRVVASGVFIDRGGKIINATAVTFNRATPAIKAAIKEMEGAGDELLIKFPLPPGYDKVNNHLHHAEILLYNWARNAGNSVASIAAGNVAGNCGMCAEFFRNASAKQLAEEGFPIFFR
jgi:RHS repeat-associated protein